MAYYYGEILNLQDMYKLNLLKLMYKYYHKELPVAFDIMFTSNVDIHNYETRQRLQPI